MFLTLYTNLLYIYFLVGRSLLDPSKRSSKCNLIPSESVLQVCQKYMVELYLRTSSECLRKLIGKRLTLNLTILGNEQSISLPLSSGVW